MQNHNAHSSKDLARPNPALMSAYTAMRPFKTTLANGLHVNVRDVVPADKPLIELGFERLSKRSRYFRFLAPHDKLTDSELARFSASNDRDHVAIAAGTLRAGEDAPVGIGRFVRLDQETKTAEIALTIVDEYQGMGVGTLLLGCLAKRATDLGIETFLAFSHHENQAMHALLLDLGGKVTGQSIEEIEIRLPLHVDPTRYPKTSAGDHVRTAYDLTQTEPG